MELLTIALIVTVVILVIFYMKYDGEKEHFTSITSKPKETTVTSSSNTSSSPLVGPVLPPPSSNNTSSLLVLPPPSLAPSNVLQTTGNEAVFTINKIKNDNVMSHADLVLNVGDNMLYVFGINIMNPVIKSIS